jgi:NAD(P)-dependent dehydrogenase (short-subunit alcohol dehydrogenase family)
LFKKDLHQETNIKVFAVCPGWVNSDMGGKEAPRIVEQVAASVLCPVLSGNNESGKFYSDGKLLEW